MKKIFALIACLTIAYLSYSQPTPKIRTIGTDTLLISKQQVNKAVKAFVMVEGLNTLLELKEAKIDSLNTKIANQNFIIEKRTQQVADSTMVINAQAKAINKKDQTIGKQSKTIAKLWFGLGVVVFIEVVRILIN